MTGKTLLIGSGACAHRIAEDLLTQESDLIIASTGEVFGLPTTPVSKDMAEEWAMVYTKTKVHSCRGAVGDFKVVLERNGEKKIAAVDQIIIAEDEKRIPGFSDDGLTQTAKVMALSQLEKLLHDNSEHGDLFSGIKTVVFLVADAESNPVILEEIMQSCLKLQAEHKRKIYILTKNLKVAATGLAKMYQDTKAAGVLYIKFTHARPDIVQVADGRVRIEFTDEVTGILLKLAADLTIVDETIVPSDYATDLAPIFELEEDLNGFAQGDNVHRLTVFTNRKGILVAGPARTVKSLPDQFTDADNAALSLRKIERHPADQTTGQGPDRQWKVRTLPDLLSPRPYRAIQVNTRVSIAPAACEGCGICLTECPRGAISFLDQKRQPVPGCLPLKSNGRPENLLFHRSRHFAAGVRPPAPPSWQLVWKKMPPGFRIVEVPCGGSVSLSHILKRCSNADGVMILTCHEGNCHSEVGPRHAQQRVEQISEHFRSIGLQSGRLVKKTLASNMGLEFAGARLNLKNSFWEWGRSS